MISDGAATGKPVHILELDGSNTKFAHFHEAMPAAGITRPFCGRVQSWSDPIRDDAARAGAALRTLVLPGRAAKAAVTAFAISVCGPGRDELGRLLAPTVKDVVSRRTQPASSGIGLAP